MKKYMILTALLFSAFLTIGQPAPELLYKTTEPTPTFITVEGLTTTDTVVIVKQITEIDTLTRYEQQLKLGVYYAAVPVTVYDTIIRSDTTYQYNIRFIDDRISAGDCLFVYAGDKVYGSKEVKFPTGYVAAFGSDRFDNGLEYGQPFNIGLYDNETKQFYQLQGTVTDWLKGVKTSLKWYPMGLFKFEVTGVGDPVALVADTELAEVKITIEAPDQFVNDGTLFLKLNTKNVENVQVLSTGKGTVTPVERWITGVGWVNYSYQPSTDDNIVFINAVGQNQFTGALIHAQHTVKIIQKDEPKPEPEPEVIVKHEADNYKIIIKPYVKNLLAWYFVNTSETTISYRVMLYNEGKKALNTGTVKPGEEKRIMPLSMYTEIEVFDLSIAGKRYRINQKLTY